MAGGRDGDARIVVYDDDLIERVAWKLAVADGYKYGRCGQIDSYMRQVRDIVVALEVAAEERQADAGTPEAEV